MNVMTFCVSVSLKTMQTNTFLQVIIMVVIHVYAVKMLVV